MRSGGTIHMSQILATSKSGLIQEFAISKKKSFMTSVSFVKCNVCGKGIEDGFSITAKSIQKKIFFFCDIHNN